MALTKMVFFLCMVLLGATSHSQTKISPVDSTAFGRVDVDASFPGGADAWKKFLQQNLEGNTPVNNGAPIGKYTVIVQFFVDTNGNASGIEALTNLGYGMEQAVIGLIKKAGVWSPAMLNKKPVNSYRRQPVTFMVEQDEFEITSAVPYVLFTGTDNELTVAVDKIKNKDLKLTISQGSITMTDDDKFIARVTKPGRAIIEVYNKKNKRIAEVSFTVSAPSSK